jgi:hypothetical protein
MRLVTVESPLRGKVPSWVPLWAAAAAERLVRQRNRRYAKQCMRDSLARGEAPYASHLLFDQSRLLDDADPKQRAIGMRAGMVWGSAAEARVVYCDLGISDGMMAGVASTPLTQVVEFRWLFTERDSFTEQRIARLQKMLAQRRGSPGPGAEA